MIAAQNKTYRFSRELRTTFDKDRLKARKVMTRKAQAYRRGQVDTLELNKTPLHKGIASPWAPAPATPHELQHVAPLAVDDGREWRKQQRAARRGSSSGGGNRVRIGRRANAAETASFFDRLYKEAELWRTDLERKQKEKEQEEVEEYQRLQKEGKKLIMSKNTRQMVKDRQIRSSIPTSKSYVPPPTTNYTDRNFYTLDTMYVIAPCRLPFPSLLLTHPA